MKRVKTRFAPSPTGDLHIGGARTALFNWLFARHEKGKFVLRIEDTDVERSTAASTEGILEAMAWLGMDWDEGPYFQTERLALYKEAAERLLREGKAYRCYCSPEELEAKRQAALKAGLKPKYDRTCLRRTVHPDRPFAIRFLSPDEGTTVVEDLIQGKVAFSNAELDDLIIIRSDGLPTYNFSVVVDDATMEITHVIRGNDHLNNTPRQIQIYRALGFPVPRFAHVPMILGPDKKKLSKRHGAPSVLEYRRMGYLPEAVVNYLVRLGWSYGDQEEFSREELIEKFSLESVGKSPAAINPGKLDWLNSQYIKKTDVRDLAHMVRPFIEALGLRIRSEALLIRVVRSLRDRAKTLREMAELSRFYFVDEVVYDRGAAEKFLTEEASAILKKAISFIPLEEAWSREECHRLVLGISESLGLPLVKIAQPLRVALTGRTVSPPIDEVMEALGPHDVERRLEKAVDYIERQKVQRVGV